MGPVILKFIKWYVSIGFFILGVAYLQNFSDTGDVRNLSVVLIGFAVIYWMSKATYEAPKATLMATVIVLFITGVAAHFVVHDLVFYYLGGGYYMAWFLGITVLGLPVMLYRFRVDE